MTSLSSALSWPTRMGLYPFVKGIFSPRLPLNYFLWKPRLKNADGDPELYKLNGPTINSCFWLPKSNPGPGLGGGALTSSLPIPSRRGTRRRLQASLSQLIVGAPKAGHRLHPNSNLAPNTSTLLLTPISTPSGTWGKHRHRRINQN